MLWLAHKLVDYFWFYIGNAASMSEIAIREQRKGTGQGRPGPEMR